MLTSTDAARRVMVRTDVDLFEEEFSLPSPKPLGHFITPIHDREYALVSKRAGVIGYFPCIDLALPLMRMLYRNRVRPCGPGDVIRNPSAVMGEREPGGLDFRLYLYDRQACCWMAAICQLELPTPEAPKEETCPE